MEEEHVNEPPTKTRRVDKRSVHLTSDQEEGVINFLLDNPAIYDSRKGNFRQTKVKEAAWASLGSTLKVPEEDLYLWYTNMRTQLGKLRTRIEKSGAGDEQLTDRQRWQWRRLQFLVPHIKRKMARRSEPPVSRSQSSYLPFPESQYQPLPEEHESEGSETDTILVKSEYELTTTTTESTVTLPTTAASTSSSGHCRHDLGSTSCTDNRVDALCEFTHAILQSRQGNREVRSYTDWVYEAMVAMSPDIADDCMTEITAVITKFKKKMRNQPLFQPQEIPPH